MPLYSGYAKIALISGISAAVYLSAGVAWYYLFKKRERERERVKTQRRRNSVNACKTQRRGKSGAKSTLNKSSSQESVGYCSSSGEDLEKYNKERNQKISPKKRKNSQQASEKSQHSDESSRELSGDSAFAKHGDDDDWSPEEEVQATAADEQRRVGDGSHDDDDGEVREVLANIFGDQANVEADVRAISAIPKANSVESPSNMSQISQDSGKGVSPAVITNLATVTVPEAMSLKIEPPPIYEFEVPQDIVGLLIGRKGTTIKQFTDESGAHIVIRHHYYSNKHKICTIEGSREQINKCLRLIRHKFPPSRFPELKLTPLLPPPVVTATSQNPYVDPIINLTLPEDIKCDVVVCSLVDAGHFFVQQPTHPTFPSLARLDTYMLAVYGLPANVPGLPRPIEDGVICAAPVLSCWYRAQTVEMYDDTDEVLVKFVDYGGYSRISASDLRQIRSDFMNLPFQAIECALAHVKPLNENDGWSAEAYAFVEERLINVLVEAQLVAKDESGLLALELYSKIDEPAMLNQLLVEKGYAKWIDDYEEKN